jgi:MIR domain
MYVSIAFYGSVNVCGESGEMLVLPGERCRCDDTTCDTSCTLLSRMVVVFTRFVHFFLPPPRPALNYVTCGSLVKLKHVTTEARLHSHNVNYMTGSRQQSVTGLKSAADPSSFWTIREPYGQPQCIQGFVVECFPLHTDRATSPKYPFLWFRFVFHFRFVAPCCVCVYFFPLFFHHCPVCVGVRRLSLWKPSPLRNARTPIASNQKIRLFHAASGKFLHSHQHSSPITRYQEVSCFGGDTQSNTGDDWLLTFKGAFWIQESKVRLQHVDTGAYLHCSNNAYPKPIEGQLEVAARPRRSADNLWLAAEGIFFPRQDQLRSSKA